MKIQWLYLVIEFVLQYANKPIYIIVILILLIILAIVVMGGLAVPKIIKSNNDYRARRLESDNLLKIKLAKSESEFLIRKYESDNLLKIELAKLEREKRSTPP